MMSMKRIISVVFLLLLLGCTKLYDNNITDFSESYCYEAFWEDVVSVDKTRTYLDENLKLLWHSQDEISIFTSTLNQKYQFTGKTGDNSGSFSLVPSGNFGGANEIKTNYAVYPYDDNNKIESDESYITVPLPHIQNYAKSSVGKKANISVAVTTGITDNLLKFKNACSYIQIRLYGDGYSVKSIEFKGNGGEMLAGTARIAASNTDVPKLSVINDADAVESILLDCGSEGVELEASKENYTDFWIVLPPTIFTQGLKLFITDVNGNRMTRNYSSKFDFKRSEYMWDIFEFKPTENITKQIEKEALIALYNSLGGSGWTNKVNWCSDKPVEEWYGVTVNGEGFVTGVSFENNNLLGTIPAEIGNLTNLKSLRIVGEPGVTGSIPEEICNLESLETLQIENNESLSGNIPENIGDLTNLVTLSVKGCSVSGTMPESIGNLVKLKSLDLSDNNLSGQIPDEFGNMLALEELYLEGNGLWGMIFSHLVKFPNLEVCNLRGNDFIGQIPDEIGSLKNLTTLDVGSNHLWGTLPASLVDCLALKELDLSYNSDLSGILAASLFGRLTNCNIEGTGIELEKGSNLQDPQPGGDISWN